MMGLIWRPLAIGLAAALLIGVPFAYLKGRGDGREAVYAKMRIQTEKRNKELERGNASFKSLSDVERCRLFMRDSGLPSEACD
jgi:hypothetical protein